MTFIEILKGRTPASLRSSWERVEHALKLNKKVLTILEKMEASGGEPMLVRMLDDEAIFMDGSDESPKGRRSLCFDEAAWQSRKQNKPKASVEGMTKEIGGILLNELDYRDLQQVKSVDLKTSSWIATPSPIRELGGALFMDSRYNAVFLYHNGAESYYEARGFRLKVILPLGPR